ncbi:hypothetical protein [Companilactobacillus musae]|uniref:hypothetical protein n=1 Tax=Companilactobacillus musae TaxID=1903258 RepID=UPI000E65806D|nr:hypothetical protein [Companilactobacillus musae]
MKKVELSSPEIDLLSSILDEYIYEHDLFDLSVSENGSYISDEYPIDAERANLISNIYDKL